MYARVLLYTLIAGCVLFEVLSWRSVHQDQKVNIIQHWYSAVYAMYRHVGNMYGGQCCRADRSRDILVGAGAGVKVRLRLHLRLNRRKS